MGEADKKAIRSFAGSKADAERSSCGTGDVKGFTTTSPIVRHFWQAHRAGPRVTVALVVDADALCICARDE